MKIVFVSNYFNHHQEPFSNAMAKLVDEYYFVATTPFNQKRLALGYEDMNFKYPYIIRAYETGECKDFALKVISEADFVIFGSAPEEYIKDRINRGGVVFRYTERLYKKPTNPLKFPVRIFTMRKRFYGYKNQFMLCASAYTPYDFYRSRSFIGKTFKWGYFPETTHYDENALLDGKEKNTVLWVGRTICWKHSEYAVMLAKKFKDDGVGFKVKIIGTGEMDERLKSLAKEFDVLDGVEFLGSISPVEVRKNMEKAEIFIFTSNREEGWGAVLNEAMNSGCATVSSHACGSVPFMVKDGENGLIFESENFDDFYRKVRILTDDAEKRKKISINAYKTVIEEWNADVAAKNFLTLCKTLNDGKDISSAVKVGVCSKAEVLKDNWYVKEKTKGKSF